MNDVFQSLLAFESEDGLCWCCAMRSEQAITNKRIEETLTQTVGEANTRARLNTNCGVNINMAFSLDSSAYQTDKELQ
jgi:hypothetical protein